MDLRPHLPLRAALSLGLSVQLFPAVGVIQIDSSLLVPEKLYSNMFDSLPNRLSGIYTKGRSLKKLSGHTSFSEAIKPIFFCCDSISAFSPYVEAVAAIFRLSLLSCTSGSRRMAIRFWFGFASNLFKFARILRWSNIF